MFKVVQIGLIKITPGSVISSKCKYELSSIVSGKTIENKKFFKRRKVGRDGAEVTWSGRLFQMVGPETDKARPSTVDSLSDGTCRQLVRVERRLQVDQRHELVD